MNDDNGQRAQCSLLGGTFELSIQLVLATTAVAALVYKRSRERGPRRRSWLIWALDCSKQAYASALQHATNIILGVVFAESGSASQCAWYIVNFTITVFCGLFLLSAAMKLYNSIVEKYNLTILVTGEYGDPPTWKHWLAQSIVWGFLASAEKFVTALVIILPLQDKLDIVASSLEVPLLNYPRVELILVMVVGPLLLNTLFFWVIDSIIMRKREKLDEDGPHEELGEAVIAYDVFDDELNKYDTNLTPNACRPLDIALSQHHAK